MREALDTHQSITVTLVNYRKDGTAFWNEVSVSPVFDGARRPHELRRRAGRRHRQGAGRGRARGGVPGSRAGAEPAGRAGRGERGAVDHPRRRRGAAPDGRRNWCRRSRTGARSTWPSRRPCRGVAVAHKDPTGWPRCGRCRRPRACAATVVSTVLSAGQPQLFVRDRRRPAGRAGRAARAAGAAARGRRDLGHGRAAAGAQPGARRAVARAWPTTTATYDEEDLSMAVDIGRRAGLAVDNAQLYGKEHEVAVALQRSMLPRVPPVPGLEISAHYFAGSERADVGGDWYDVLAAAGRLGRRRGRRRDGARPHRRGRDGPAALGARASYAWEGHRPSEVLERLDRLVQGLGMAQLATCCTAGSAGRGRRAAALRERRAPAAGGAAPRRRGGVLDGGKSVLIGRRRACSSEGGRPDGTRSSPAARH